MFKDGRVIYDGDWQNGKPHGTGTSAYPNGDKYVGHFQNGKRHGKGKQMSEDRRIIYDGDWKDGQKHGQGFFFQGGGDGYPDPCNYENGVKLNFIVLANKRYVLEKKWLIFKVVKVKKVIKIVKMSDL